MKIEDIEKLEDSGLDFSENTQLEKKRKKKKKKIMNKKKLKNFYLYLMKKMKIEFMKEIIYLLKLINQIQLNHVIKE